MIFNLLKTIHIISIVSWMAGLLYLPRIFVYHSNLDISKDTSNIFKIMERRLYFYIMWPAAIVTWLTGLLMLHYVGISLWLIIKIFFVVILSLFHLYLGKCVSQFNKDQNTNSSKFYRFINEVPTISLIIIVILVIFKPF